MTLTICPDCGGYTYRTKRDVCVSCDAIYRLAH